MPEPTKDTTGNAEGNRSGGSANNDTPGNLARQAQSAAPGAANNSDDKDANSGFGLDNFHKDVKGSLKIHIKLDLDVDIHITARIKGDIAIGLL